MKAWLQLVSVLLAIESMPQFAQGSSALVTLRVDVLSLGAVKGASDCGWVIELSNKDSEPVLVSSNSLVTALTAAKFVDTNGISWRIGAEHGQDKRKSKAADHFMLLASKSRFKISIRTRRLQRMPNSSFGKNGSLPCELTYEIDNPVEVIDSSKERTMRDCKGSGKTKVDWGYKDSKGKEQK